MQNTTPSGAPNAKSRDKYGMPDGSYPVFNHDTAMKALNLRGNSKTYSAAQIVAHVRRWAVKASDQAVINACDDITKPGATGKAAAVKRHGKGA